MYISMEICEIIYLYVACIVFSMSTFTRTSMNNLDSATNSTFHVGGSSLPKTVILHTFHGRKGNKLK